MPELRFGVLDRERDTDVLAQLLARAFGFKPEAAPPWFESAGWDNVRTVHRGDRIEAGCMVLPMGQFFGDTSIPLGGVAAVGVRSDARRSGTATWMMLEVVRELAARGTPLAALYASNVALYRRAGFELAGMRHLAKVRPRELVGGERALAIRDVEPSDLESIYALYRRAARNRNGHLDRGGYIWRRIHDERYGVPAHGVMLVDEHGAPEGYLFFRQHKGDPFIRAEITDWIAATPRAHRQLWTTLGDLRTMFEHVEMTSSPNDPLVRCLPDPRIEWGIAEPWMLRLCDVVGALETRGYAEGVRTQIALHVHDDGVAANDGRFVLHVDGGHGTVERGGDGTVELDVRALASIYSGFADPRVLAAGGWVHGPADGLSRLAACFAGEAPWMRELF
ncbi:MAG: GNAT family N-acetyltransferase [Deltaproteobacteria bacterium]|nr:GNAT family N-acetyltransferase [Nannocystaceae bacterium]